jgi:crotonobetainyl-CoA:carnitine CoA-transferase CaiB-like acyl-CoA transferase
LVEKSDAVIESFSPGVMDRLGLGYEQLAQRKPDLILLSMRGSSVLETAPDSPSYAPITSCLAGLEAAVGYEGESATGAMAFGLADPNAGAHGLVVLFAALIGMRRTGRGGWIRVSQLEALVSVLRDGYLEAQGVTLDTNETSALACDDGYVMLSREPKTSLPPGPSRLSRSKLGRSLRRNGAIAQPVVAADDAVRARRREALVAPTTHPHYGPETLVRLPWLAEGLELRVRGSAPLIGQHTKDIARAVLGLSSQEVDDLIDRQVLV